MNKIAALALVAGLGAEVSCRPEVQTPLEKQAVKLGVDLDEVKEIRKKLLGELGVDFEGFCDNKGEDRCTYGDFYSTQCAINKDASNAYFNARDAAMAEVEKHAGSNHFLNYSVDAVTQDGISVNCVKSVIDTGHKSNLD